MTKKAILFCYGSGGHAAQMKRLAPDLVKDLSDYLIISMSDSSEKPFWSDKHIVTGEFRKKSSNLEILNNIGPLNILLKTLELIFRNNIVAIVSTGPGISAVASLVLKFMGKKVIHVETWSRFKTKSFTGRVMYLLADRFYVQNKSLLELYPKATYSGRL